MCGPPEAQRQAIVFSLGDAARCAVRFMRERRSDVRVRLPDGEILKFEEFQQAVFAGRLSDKPVLGKPEEPAIPGAMTWSAWRFLPRDDASTSV
jgi:hypothetical protein